MARRGRHVALLRGINLGAKNKIAMPALAAMFEAAGCRAVRTYIQSGNVVFEAPAKVARGVGSDIPARIEEELGLRVPVVVVSAAELETIVRDNPFLTRPPNDKALHVMFLRERPSAAAVAELDPDRSPPDEYAVRGRAIYLHCPNGVARTKLSNAYFDAKLGTVSTSRNWRTTSTLLSMAQGA